MTLDDYVMRIGKIPFIVVADSKVFPDSGKAVVRENAEMDLLINAKIKADTLNQYHEIERVSIQINGRTNCTGAGTYTYLDSKKKPQQFYMDEIYVVEKKFLEGKTLIPDSINFMVGPKIGFRGKAILHSYDKNLEYNGFFKGIHEQFTPKTDWFKAAATINPDSVHIGVPAAPTNLNKQALTNGFYVSNDSTHVYSAIFSRKRNTTDLELMRCEGTFTYFEKMDEFRVGPYGKVFGNERRGNFMAMSESKKLIYGEGKFNLGFNSKGFNVTSAGYCTYGITDTSYGMKLTMLINMLIPPQALKMMTDSIIEQSSGSGIDFYDKRVINISIPELVDDKVFKRLSEDAADELNSKNMVDLEKTFFFTDVPLVWNHSTRTFNNVGDLGLRSIEKTLIERKIKANLQIKRTRGTDEFILYINTGSWYFFKYQKGIMTVISSDKLFNETLKNNIDKVAKQADDYSLRQANISDRNKFVKALKK
jgi:hypothetical protein